MAKKQPQPLLPPHLSIAELIKATANESDRGFVLQCASFLERALEKLIRAGWSNLSDATKEEMDYLLTENFPPLGSAKIRARLARILGWIDKTTCRALCEMFEVRNHFAHWEIPPALGEELFAPIKDNLKVSKHFKVQSGQLAGIPGQRRPLFAATFELWLIMFLAEGKITTPMHQPSH